MNSTAGLPGGHTPDAGTSIHVYLNRLEDRLRLDFGAQGQGLSELATALRLDLPEELGQPLQQLAEQSLDGATCRANALEIAYQCGRLMERLQEFRRARAAEALMLVDSEGRTLADPERVDLDRVSRFIAFRDRLLRQAADFSLKLLAGAVLVLIVGFALGLI